ncbi:hypothetical protein GE21DRAFT_10481 [Neurospora crassa]|uniref:Uncharacterized protein n=1 Tax=Neurospora crassa (strain ATCC 24698 / 74-OR23-1A / CBS 708.71 / DSM 1257 / FGSC 987) TaxID=367110 RepID=Q7S440_NEUCR|nr:hypothetical protein NCU02239 [Neurospora crassa OR74A]EAA30262.2 hypothetical protein NCU02239 [Neurospora crassa OR74A]KHE84103.1 hypothetical protein GE21DRAFT_10481 [Neurospora crassa]|eukprot:XP_959498.2 hypothetical protein NCU02239 [Neurospora crassa OR74A]
MATSCRLPKSAQTSHHFFLCYPKSTAGPQPNSLTYTSDHPASTITEAQTVAAATATHLALETERQHNIIMSHLHFRKAMALPSRMAQYLKRRQSRKSGKVSQKKHQAAAYQMISSTNPNPRKRSSEDITDATRDVSADRFIDADAAPPQKRPRWPVVEGRDEFRPSRPRKRSSDEFDEASSDASSDRFVDADAPPPQKRPRWPATEDSGECEFNPFIEKKSRSLAEDIADATAHEDRDPFDYDELASHVQRYRSLAEEIADATAHEDGEAFDDEADEAPSTARFKSLAEELAYALVNESGDELDKDEETKSPQRHPLADELADATADADGNPFEDEELVGMTIAKAGGLSYVEATIDLAHLSFDHGTPTSFRPLRPLAEELTDVTAYEDIEPFDNLDELSSGLPGLTDDDDSNSIFDGGSVGDPQNAPTEEESLSLKHKALVPQLQGRSLADELFDATSEEEGNPFAEADADLHLRLHSLEDQIADALSRNIGQGLDDVDSAPRMCLNSPAKKMLDSIASEGEDISDIEYDASFITALETLSENDFHIEDDDAPTKGRRRRSLADEIADATWGEEGDPFDVAEDSPANDTTSEPSAEVRKRPFWLWTKYPSTPMLLGGCPMQ